MFSFFRKKPPTAEALDPSAEPAAASEAGSGVTGRVDKLHGAPAAGPRNTPATDAAPTAESATGKPPATIAAATAAARSAAAVPPLPAAGADAVEPIAVADEPASRLGRWLGRLRGDGDEAPLPAKDAAATDAVDALTPAAAFAATPQDAAEPPPESAESRRRWLDRLRGGLRRTGSGIAQVFTTAQIDDALYEELETALLMADAGVKATEYLLDDLKRRVRETRTTEPQAVRALLVDAIAELLDILEKDLEVGRHTPTVMMVAGVNGAGKTTTIGKLTRHLAAADKKVLLAAADTFRAAAREQLAVWADRNRVDIVSQQGGDPAAVTFDAVIAGKARGCDVVIADTAGRLTTQAHLMEELKKIRRVIAKAQDGAPHEVLLVVDGNTGQNALAQVQAFDAALGVTGLVVTKLDGTAKGGVLAAIAMWSRERLWAGEKRVPVYFIGVGEKLEDLQTFKAREFAQALLS